MKLSPSGVAAAPEILLPREGIDLAKWAVVACDQYTSQPDYWQRVERAVGEAPSTLRLVYPEVYLEAADRDARIRAIGERMRAYLGGGVFDAPFEGMVYVRRQTSTGIRQGLVLAVDLEAYDYHPGSASPIRATEATIEERLPPRVRIRQGAPLESPHILLLMDDLGDTVLGNLFPGPLRYDVALMEGGGRIQGYRVDGEQAAGALARIDALPAPGGMRLAVGDGNHSLATAKACYERIKAELPPERAAAHPARYALCELVNLHEPSLVFEPIHRVLFGVEPEAVLEQFAAWRAQRGVGEGEQVVTAVYAGGERRLRLDGAVHPLAVGTVQRFLDDYLAVHPEVGVDYIHGAEVVGQLADGAGNLGFILPAMDKGALFPAVAAGGSLPRKTFSMGHAQEKRYYMECRSIAAS